MAKIVFAVFITQVIANGWWYCATQQDTLGQTPVIIIPVFASILGFAISVMVVIKNWDN